LLGSGEPICTQQDDIVTLIGGVNYKLLPNATSEPTFQVFANEMIYGTDLNTLETVVYIYKPDVTLNVTLHNNQTSRITLQAGNYLLSQNLVVET
jgi:hypothetical protein